MNEVGINKIVKLLDGVSNSQIMIMKWSQGLSVINFTETCQC